MTLKMTKLKKNNKHNKKKTRKDYKKTKKKVLYGGGGPFKVPKKSTRPTTQRFLSKLRLSAEEQKQAKAAQPSPQSQGQISIFGKISKVLSGSLKSFGTGSLRKHKGYTGTVPSSNPKNVKIKQSPTETTNMIEKQLGAQRAQNAIAAALGGEKPQEGLGSGQEKQKDPTGPTVAEQGKQKDPTGPTVAAQEKPKDTTVIEQPKKINTTVAEAEKKPISGPEPSPQPRPKSLGLEGTSPTAAPPAPEKKPNTPPPAPQPEKKPNTPPPEPKPKEPAPPATPATPATPPKPKPPAPPAPPEKKPPIPDLAPPPPAQPIVPPMPPKSDKPLTPFEKQLQEARKKLREVKIPEPASLPPIKTIAKEPVLKPVQSPKPSEPIKPVENMNRKVPVIKPLETGITTFGTSSVKRAKKNIEEGKFKVGNANVVKKNNGSVVREKEQIQVGKLVIPSIFGNSIKKTKKNTSPGSAPASTSP